MSGEALEAALSAYNDVWQRAPAVDAGNVDAVRREAMVAALSATNRLGEQIAERALREFCDEHGPSGSAWNISSVLDCVRAAFSDQPTSD